MTGRRRPRRAPTGTTILAATVVALLGVTSTVTSCSADADPAATSASTSRPVPTGPDDVVPTTWPPLDREAATAAALDVRVEGCGPRIRLGAGAMIDDGVAVTAAHVVAGAERVEVTGVDGRTAAATVVFFDPELDVAVLRTPDPVGTPVAPRTEPAAVGETGVIVLPRRDGGSADPTDPTVTIDETDHPDRADPAERDAPVLDVVDVEVLRSVRINTTDIYGDAEVTRDGFELAAEVDPGDSGGVVVLAGGAVGIVWARSNARENRAWAVDLPALDTDRLTGQVDVGPCVP